MGKERKYNATKVHDNELNMLLALFDGVDETMYVSDPDTYDVLFANKKVKELFGRHVIGKKCYKVFQNLNSPCSFCTNKYIFGPNIGKTHIWEFQNRKNKRWYRCIDKAIPWPNGKYVRYELAIDVTEQKRMEKDRKWLEERLSALNTYGQKLNMAKDKEEVYTITLDAIEKTLGFEYAAFMIINKNNLQVASQRGYLKPLLFQLPLDGTKKGITVKVANTRQPILVPDTEKDKNYVEGIPGVRSELAVPIEIEGKILGVLNVESKKIAAFDEKDIDLLQILASHAATAISNIEKRKEIEKRSHQLASLMKSSTRMISSTDLHQRLQTIAEVIRELGWRRVVISVRDENMEIRNPEDIVTAGLTDEEREFLWKNRSLGEVWLERFGPEYKRFRVGEFYHLPWSDPWVRKKFSKSTIPSKLPPEEMIDWDPQDLLYAPLRLAEGRIVGILSIDDPVDGRRPTKESLAPLELFIHQAAVAIENAQLIQDLRAREEALQKSQLQLRAQYKGIPIPTYTWQKIGNDFVLKDYNDAAESITQGKVKDFVGIRASQMYKDRPKIIADLNRCFDERIYVKREMWYKFVSGKKFYFSVHYAFVPPDFVLVSTEDITERKKVEEALRDSEKKFRAISTSAKDAIVLMDNEGKISYWNPAAEKIFGYTKEEVIGKYLQEFLAPKRFYKKFLRGFEKFKENGQGNTIGKILECTAIRKDATKFPIELSLSALQMKGKWHAIGIARDITERKQMQEKLKKYSQQLEELVERRTRQLKKSQEQLLKAQRLAAIGELANMVGHDLRNPLTGIAGATYYLKSKLVSKMDKKTREMLELIEKNIEYSNKIISDLLEYSREMQLELTETTPKQIVKETLSLVKIPRNVQVIDLTQSEPRIKVDVQKMKRVFVNIVKNAVDAMSKGGKLTINSSISDGNVEIIFVDTGTGITKEVMKKLWLPLFTTKAKGMGLGLSICKRIVETHGGDIFVESVVGKGTTFKVTIPLKPKLEGGEKTWMNKPKSLLSTTMKV
ncbi:MAG: PAS domain S-box protein [Candidatus Bathyarchaeia archaeon]